MGEVRTLDVGLPTRGALEFTIDLHNARLVRGALGADEHVRYKDEGRAMSADDAAAHALEGLRT